MAKWKHLNHKSALIVGIFLIQRAILAGDLTFEAKVHYPPNDPRLTVTVVVGKEQEDDLPYFEHVTLQAIEIVENEFKINFRDHFSIVFDNRPDFHNGLTTVLPTNRIYVHTEVPNLESSIGLVHQAHLETAVHEMAHMMVIQQRRSFWTPLSWVVGNLARPNLLFPTWVHEGFAVWAESQMGGRGQNGVVQTDIRKYAEYFKRTGRIPLPSDLLDGSLESVADGHPSPPGKFTHSIVEPGEYPYHFGYLLIDDLLKGEKSQTPGFLLQKSAGRIGFLFHNLFRDNGKILTDRFHYLQSEWAQTPVDREENPLTISSARKMLGPFSSNSGMSWVETDDDRNTQLKFVDSQAKIFVTKWNRAGVRPERASWSHSLNLWVVLAAADNSNTNSQLRKSFFLVDAAGNFVCENDSRKRVREFSLDGSNLGIIRSDAQGFFYFERTQLSKNCQFGPTELILRTTQPFERLSHPWINGNEWLLSKSRGQNLSEDFIVGNRNLEFHSPQGALGFPQKIDGCEDCLLATLYQKNFRGPVVINTKSGSIQKFSQKTESPSSYSLAGKIFSREAYWDQERIVTWQLNQKSPLDSSHLDQPVEYIVPSDPVDNVSTQKYSAWPSIIPHFWFPSYQLYDRGYNLKGSTYFADLAKNWSGTLEAGYDSGGQRPVGYLQIDRDALNWGLIDQWEFSGYSNFNFIGNKIQDVQLARTQLRLTRRLNSRFYFALLPGVEYRRGTSVANVKPYSVIAPALGLKFASPRAVNVRAASYQITKFNDAFYFLARARWLPQTSFEVFSNFQGKAGKFGYLLGLEYARTPPAAFPKVFYEWGGRPLFSTLDTGYLARGFTSNIGPALQLIRGNFETGFKILDVNRGIPWNRFHLKDVEFRPLYEVVTSDLYGQDSQGNAVPSNVKVGRQFFHTVGAELDFFIQVLHYWDAKATFGVYQGLGAKGKTLYGVQLVSLLDFL